MPPNTLSPASISVTELNRLVRQKLEKSLPLLWINGEISNLTRAASGHLYFTLKDEDAQVRCTLWRNRAHLLSFRPENGQRVYAYVAVTLYEARGDYQLNIENLRPAGTGTLFEAFIQLKEKLAAEGLFNPERRRPIPAYPRVIALITSPAAAALHDICATLQRRAPHLPVIVYPAQVQGADAPAQLIQALHRISERYKQDRIDLVLMVRGGGSLEDLWAFNNEALARALKNCPVPVITGVGHETDFTIADFAADLRAPTPTGAAELASAGYHSLLPHLNHLALRLQQALQHRLNNLNQRLDHLSLRLLHPRKRLQQAEKHQYQLAIRLRLAAQRQLEQARLRHTSLQFRLKTLRPDIGRAHAHCQQLAQRFEHSLHQLIRRHHERLNTLDAYLHHLDPHAVLARGYSITRNADGIIVKSADLVESGATLCIQLAKGHLTATATIVTPED